MARGINKVILVGTLGRDPETKYMPSGGAVTNMSIATSEQWKDKNTGEKQERTEWHRIVFFGRLAEIAGQYLRKGSQVYIEGSLRTRKWQDQSGQDKYTTEIVAAEMQMLGGRNDNGGSGGASDFGGGQQQGGGSYGGGQQQQSGGGYGGGQQQGGGAPAPRPQQPAPAPANQQADRGFEDFDDDIPF